MQFRQTDEKSLLRERKPIVILAPHPDDEIFGCGLLIAEAISRGIPVTVIVLTDGQASHPGSATWPPAALAKLRRSETRRALARLGAARATLRFMGWRDGQLAADCNLLHLRRLLHPIGSAILLAPSPHDFHPDHQAAWRIGQALAKPVTRPVVAYAVWSRITARQVHSARHPANARKRWAANAHRSQISAYIRDDPDGFRMDRAAFKRLCQSPERFGI